MTVKAILWKYKPRQDGSCNIKIYVNSKSGKAYHKTRFYALPNDWDNRKGELKRSAPNHRQINSLLRREIDQRVSKLVGGNGSLLELIGQYIGDCKNGLHPIAYNTWRQYVTHLAKLQAFLIETNRSDILFSDVDLNFHRDFSKFLNRQGLGEAGLGKQIKHLRKFMRLGYHRELHENRIFDNPLFVPKRYVAPPKIYLDEEEFDQVASLDLSNDFALQKEQDRFIVSYYFLLRYGDSVSISKDQFFDRGGRTYFKNVAEKTGGVSVVPVSSPAMTILQRRNYDLSGGANQDSNRKLKTIAAMANVNSSFHGEPKWKYTTTHTARRSSATNLYLQGVPLSEIMQLGGWSSESIVRKYLLASGIELATASASRSFFN